jgi:F-box interacting protein
MASSKTMEVQTARKKYIACLPEEMIEQIFVKLPASTLLRCRRVCKIWNNIIRDPQFIMAHLQQAPRCPLMFSHRETCLKKLLPSEAVLFDESWAPSRWNVPVIEPDDYLCASCNGLVCLYSDKTTIKIANLATGEFLHFEKPDKKSKGDHYYFYNFGFHPVTKEYKVIHFPCERSTLPVGNINAIQVYTLGDNKWRNVTSPKAQTLNFIRFSGLVNVDGAMYWIIEDKETSWGITVVSFDLYKEHFEWIQMPTVKLATSGGYFWITEVAGKVSVVTDQNIFYETGGFVGKLEIWTLDNKIDQIWSRKYSIQFPPVEIGFPKHFFIHGDKIVVYDLNRNIYFQKLMGQSIEIEQSKMVKVLNYSPHSYINIRSYVHVKSLVRLDAYITAGNGIVRRPKQCEGWGLKKWEKWTLELSSLQKYWRSIHQLEHSITV